MNPVLENAAVGFVVGALCIAWLIFWRMVAKPAWRKFRSAIGFPVSDDEPSRLDDNPF